MAEPFTPSPGDALRVSAAPGHSLASAHRSMKGESPSVSAPPLEPWLPVVVGTANAELDRRLQARLTPAHFPPEALGRLEALALQLARIQNSSGVGFHRLALDAPQMVVFAADHGITDEGVSAFPQDATRQRVEALLAGQAPAHALASLHGFDLTVVDAGLASQLPTPASGAWSTRLLERKIGHGTRNMLLSAAMSPAQAQAALQAGMDVARHLPGRVIALGDVGVGNTSCAALLLSRLCGVPLADACGHDLPPPDRDPLQRQHKLDTLLAMARRHRQAVKPLDVLASMGGFEIAMMVGAMLQAASERRVILIDGYVAGAAALVACGLRPAVADYLVLGHRSAEPGHRLLLIHLQAQPLLDMELRVGQGVGALLAWPLLLAAQRLLEH